MDIKGSGKKDLSSPTPNNTPRTAAPIQQQRKKGAQGSSDLSGMESRLSDLAAVMGSKQEVPEPLARRIKALKNLQDKQAELEAKFREEILALEAKYLTISKPLYEKRAAIVNGKAEPTPEEYEREDSDLDGEVEAKLILVEEETKGAKKAEEVKGIPEFWATALKNHPLIKETIQEQDHEPLKFLLDIRVSYSNDNLAFTLEFEFAPNPYFTNQVLTKTYHLVNNVDPSIDDVVFSTSEGCDIKWKEGKNLTVKVETKKHKNKSNKKTRVVKKEVPQETFFRFFTPPAIPEEDEQEDEQEDELGNSLEEKIEIDFEIGEVLKAKIVPHAIDWFTGRALEYEEDYMDDDEGEFFDEDDDDHDGEEEEEEEDDDAPAVSNPGEKPAECAQQ